MATPGTKTYGVDNVTEVDVIAPCACRRILVQENYDSNTPPTCDLIQKMPADGDPVRVPMGTPAIYTPLSTRDSNEIPFFQVGEKAGTIKTRAGSTTVQQIPSMQI